MGLRGPPPKPTAVKKLQGNPGKRALNNREPVPPPAPSGVVKPPSWLKARSMGRKFWQQIAPILDEMKVLTTADQQALALLCDVLAEYVAAKEIIDREGFTYVSYAVKADTRSVLLGDRDPDEDEDPLDAEAVTMMVRQRPEVKIRSDAWRRAHRMMMEFGMTASARTRVKGEKEEEDEFESFLQGGGAVLKTPAKKRS